MLFSYQISAIFLLCSDAIHGLVRDNSTGEVWGYENVRENAFMFWWLYGQPPSSPPNPSRPFLMWLQGGPGASSTGFGNFAEIGPLDENLSSRSSTWYSIADLLFVDTPVGTGFSYVTPPATFTTDESQIDQDLYVFIKSFLEQLPEYQDRPLYIVGESYGGKIGASFGVRLLAGIRTADIRCNFKAVVLGDAWISPVDSVAGWAPFLNASNLLDSAGFERVSALAEQTVSAVGYSQFALATQLWRLTQQVVLEQTDEVNPFNIQQHHAPSCNKPSTNYLMNNYIRNKLQIIPSDVVWDIHRADVFNSQSGDFMKPVISEVGQLLSSGIKVVVFQGQLCDTPGTIEWMNKLSWYGLPQFKASPTMDFLVNGIPMGFVKKFYNLVYYFIKDAGHMVPSDTPEAGLQMLREIVTEEK